MLQRRKKLSTLLNRDTVRTINLGVYVSIIAVSGLTVSSAPVLGILSAVLISSFALALFYSIDNQLLNDALMSKLERDSHDASSDKQAVICEVVDNPLSSVQIEEVFQPLSSSKESVETLSNVA